MKPAVKGILIGCAIVFVLAVVFVGGVAWFVKTKGPGLVEGAKSATNDGKAFGTGKRESECVTEAMSQHRTNRSMMGTMSQALWLDACLEASTPEPEFCTGVPLTSEFTKTISWRLAKCNEFGFRGDSACQSLVQQVQIYCESPKRKEKMSQPQTQ